MSKATTVKEVLIAARWLILNRGWCREDYAKDAGGKSVDVFSNEDRLHNAVCFCTLGALSVVDADVNLTDKAENLFYTVIGTAHILNWNDAPERTKEEVIAAFDKAIARAK